MEFITAFLVLLLAVWLVWFLGSAFFRGISTVLPGGSKSAKVEGSSPKKSSNPLLKQKKRMDQAEILLEEKKYPETLKTLKNCFALELSPSRETLADIHEHNQEVLARFLELAEKQDVRIANISTLETLLNQRGESELELVKSEISYNKLKQRRSESGKDLPDWGKKEFKDKIKVLKEDRSKNLAKLKVELKKMYKQLSSVSPEKAVYH